MKDTIRLTKDFEKTIIGTILVNDTKIIFNKYEKYQLNRLQQYTEPIEDISTPIEGPFTHLGFDIIGPLEQMKK